MAAYDKKYVPILDPTISTKPTRSDGQVYQALATGLRQNAFLMDPRSRFPTLSKQWAGPVFVPDFLHPNGSLYWS